MANHLRTLLRIAVEPADGPRASRIRSSLGAASEREWREAIETVEAHALSPLIAYSLELHGVEDTVPIEILNRIRSAYRSTRLANTIGAVALDDALSALREVGVAPVIWKGVVLADSFYPDIGARYMSDIDIWIPADSLATVGEALARTGLARVREEDTADAVHFRGNGATIDAHHRVRLFEGRNVESLTTDLVPRHIQAPSIRVLDPNAFVAHLVDHVLGHFGRHGYVLRWLVDFAFVFRKWGPDLVEDRLRELLPTRRHLLTLLRTVRFVERELGVRAPAWLSEMGSRVPGLDIGEVARSRRLAMWGLPGPRGWARLTMCGLLGRPARGRPGVRLGTSLNGPGTPGEDGSDQQLRFLPKLSRIRPIG